MERLSDPHGLAVAHQRLHRKAKGIGTVAPWGVGRGHGRREPSEGSGRSRTLMRSPVVKRQTLPQSGFFPIFFRRTAGRAPSIPGHVFCLHCRLLGHQRGGTTHCWRGARRGAAECRDDAGWALRPSNFSGPSYRPRQRSRCTGAVRQCVPGSGEGPPPSTRHDDRWMYESRSGGPSQGKGSGCTAYGLVGVRDARRPA